MAEPRRVKGLLLDFDGTLVDLATDYKDLRIALREILQPHGIRLKDGSLLDGLAAAKRRKSGGGAASAFAEAVRTIDRFEWAARADARPIPGGRSLCVDLDHGGLPWAIVSNNGLRIIRWCLRSFDFPKPAAIVARGSTSKYKPDSSVGARALARIRVAPCDAIFVGDSDADSKLGRALGLETWRIEGRSGPSRAALFRRLRRRIALDP